MLAGWLVLIGFLPLAAATYEVGPGRALTSLQQVAGLLEPGDLVLVDGDATYPGGLVFTRSGAPDRPIVIRGRRVNGRRPVLSGGVNTVAFTTPWPYSGPGADHYRLEGFEITGGSSRGLFHQAADLTVRDCVIHHCPAHGLLGADQGSGSLTLEHVEVHHCGQGTTRHQIYMATDEENRPGSVFRMRFCYVHSGLGGNNVKSRAERNEIHYNWIEGAHYHELELIGPDGGDPALCREDSDVVGNVLWKTARPPGDPDYFAVVRLGGDGTGQTFGRYRFVNNTILCGARPVFRLFEGIESLEAHNNVIFRVDGPGARITRTVEAVWATGQETIAGWHNWVPEGSTHIPDGWGGTRSGTDPGFADWPAGDLRPGVGSPLLDAGHPAPSGPPGHPFPNPHHPAVFHPPPGRLVAAEVRPLDGWIDIGAWERGGGTIDGDEVWNVGDLVVLRQLLAGGVPPGEAPAICPLCGDLDGDGQLTAHDAQLLAQWLAGDFGRRPSGGSGQVPMRAKAKR